MTPERGRELIQQQIEFGSGYNREAVRLIPGEIQSVQGQAAVDRLTGQLGLNEAFGLPAGTDISRVGR